MRLDVIVDSDWAGDVATRRSITGMSITRGRHLLWHSSTLQASIGLSSAESEYYALATGAVEARHVQSVLHELGAAMTTKCHMDSCSAKQAAEKQGLGKLKQIELRGSS